MSVIRSQVLRMTGRCFNHHTRPTPGLFLRSFSWFYPKKIFLLISPGIPSNIPFGIPPGISSFIPSGIPLGISPGLTSEIDPENNSGISSEKLSLFFNFHLESLLKFVPRLLLRLFPDFPPEYL